MSSRSPAKQERGDSDVIAGAQLEGENPERDFRIGYEGEKVRAVSGGP